MLVGVHRRVGRTDGVGTGRGRSPLHRVVEDERNALTLFHASVGQDGRDSVGKAGKFAVGEVNARHALGGDGPKQRLVTEAGDAGLHHLVEGSGVVAGRLVPRAVVGLGLPCTLERRHGRPKGEMWFQFICEAVRRTEVTLARQSAPPFLLASGDAGLGCQHVDRCTSRPFGLRPTSVRPPPRASRARFSA